MGMVGNVKAPTSVRLDDFQVTGLAALQQLQDRSRSWLVARAVDRYLEEELGLSRREHEQAMREAKAEELLRGFRPQSFVMRPRTTDDE